MLVFILSKYYALSHNFLEYKCLTLTPYQYYIEKK